ncbi:MAG: hypothetical protein ACE5GC_03345 [Acidimicrobiia bacterium]
MRRIVVLFVAAMVVTVVLAVLPAAPTRAQQDRLSLPDVDTENFEAFREWSIRIGSMFNPDVVFSASDDRASRRSDEVAAFFRRQLLDEARAPEEPEPQASTGILSQIESVIVIGGFEREDPEQPPADDDAGILGQIDSDDPEAVRIERYVEALRALNPDVRVLTADGPAATPPTATPENDLTLYDYDVWLDLVPATSAPKAPSGSGSDKDSGTKLPLGEFWFNWENRGVPEYTWPQVSAMSDAEVRALGDGVVIPGFSDAPARGPDAAYFPFPGAQFGLEGPQASSVEAFCANDHYVGDRGLDVRGRGHASPEGACAWGSPAVGDGIIILSGEHLADWVALFRE